MNLCPTHLQKSVRVKASLNYVFKSLMIRQRQTAQPCAKPIALVMCAGSHRQAGFILHYQAGGAAARKAQEGGAQQRRQGEAWWRQERRQGWRGHQEENLIRQLVLRPSVVGAPSILDEAAFQAFHAMSGTPLLWGIAPETG